MLQTEEIEYRIGGVVYRGFIAHDKAIQQPKPCVMIAHDWGGRSEMFCKRAELLASKGYVGFAIDMYGDAKLGNTMDERKALLASVVNDRKLVRTRMLAAYDTAAALPWVDNLKIAAMGYCFGGLCVLDLARSGADVKGVVSFHGILAPPDTVICGKIKAKILVLHGYDDPLVPPAQVHQFAAEMTAQKADWQIHMYGNTQHSFTNPEANDPALGMHYNKTADRRSWMNAQLFFEEIF